MPRAGEAVQMIDEVAQRLGQRALVSLGWSDLTLPPSSTSDRTYIVQSVDHSAVLPLCRAAVHHGGAGTTYACASAGLPAVICPMILDQHFWAARLRDLGTGRILPYAQLSTESLSRELSALLVPSVQERAKRLSATLEDAADARNRGAAAVERCTRN
jgi:sterol 3beta-glucosyltransferase